ncbi:MAG: SPFH domain-containing protein [Novosphingobium sp.]
MTRSLRRTRAALFALGAVCLIAASSVVIVSEGEQAVITRFGAPLKVVNRFTPAGSGAGAVLKLPFVDHVIWLARGLQSYSIGDQKVHSADEQILLVDADVTYRIIDPVRLVSTLGSAERVGDQIKAVLPPLIEEQMSQRSALTIAQPGSGGGARQVLTALDAKLRAYGVQAIDFRVGRVVLPEGGQSIAIKRMENHHGGKLSEIEVASAQDAQRIVAEGEEEAAGILQKSASQDLAFYDYFSSLRNYEANFGDPARKGAATIVIPPDSDYLKHFNGK